MPVFSNRSKNNLATCDERLQDIMNELIKYMDVTVICGHRNEKEQNRAYDKGNSKLRFPQSRHNKYPSLAVDVVPYPIDWTDIQRFDQMVGAIKIIAGQKNYHITCGADWKMKDYPHIQIEES